MKKTIILLIAFVAFAVSSFGQEKTISKNFTKGASYYKYTGTSTDILDGDTYDTISLTLFLDKPQAISAYTKTTFALVGTADTTVICKLYGKVFEGDSYTQLDSTSFAGSADGSATLKSTSKPYARLDSLDSNTDDLYLYDYVFNRYLKFEYIILGNDATGTGIELEAIEIKLLE